MLYFQGLVANAVLKMRRSVEEKLAAIFKQACICKASSTLI
jgi:hypothetical protein